MYVVSDGVDDVLLGSAGFAVGGSGPHNAESHPRGFFESQSLAP